MARMKLASASYLARKLGLLMVKPDALTIRRNRVNPQRDIVDLCRCANAHLASRLDQTFPTRGAHAFEKQKFNHAIVRELARWEHARVVQDQQVARLQKRFYLAKLAMFDRLARAMQHHHPRIFAAHERTPRN